MYIFKCPYCGAQYNVAGRSPGDELECVGCTALLIVPDTSSITTSRNESIFLQVINTLAKPKYIVTAVGVIVVAVSIYFIVSVFAGNKSSEPTKIPITVIDTPNTKGGSDETANPNKSVDGVGKIETSWETQISRAIGKLNEEFGPRFSTNADNKPYLLAVERSDAYAVETIMENCNKLLSSLYRSFFDEFGKELNLSGADGVLLVVVFRSRESFDNYFVNTRNKSLSSEMTGVYEYKKRRLLVYNNARLYFNILHEGAHQLVHCYVRKPLSMLWLHEGIASYFEQFSRGSIGEMVINTDVNKERLNDAKAAIASDRYVKLGDLVRFTIDDFWGWYYSNKDDAGRISADARAYYAESWALVYFLRNYEDGRFKSQFNGYMKKALDGGGGYEDFIRSFGSIEELESLFVAYIKKLQ
ncbi:MAG: hypothetical protein A2W23_09270 [Planctomycetes bacterium RBG_16_43_13]|nr:MAG: hypothetical protein A2W23_09270 [Planctomycetes bacterium RBG_16_43_13]